MREVVAMSQGDAKLQPTRASFERSFFLQPKEGERSPVDHVCTSLHVLHSFSARYSRST